MSYEIKNEHGETVKMGGKLSEEDLTDWSNTEPMPEPPHMKYGA